MAGYRSAGAAGAMITGQTPAMSVQGNAFLTSDDALEVLGLWQRLTVPQRGQLLTIIRTTAALNEGPADPTPEDGGTA